jgi:hypothetical protein
LPVELPENAAHDRRRRPRPDALLLGELARHAGTLILHVARDGNRLATLEEAIPSSPPASKC